jgi:catechol 2,3-dioxygenase-like lactoylglutathione lyase family enzyme
MLHTRNMPRTIAWYQSVLGFTLAGAGGGGWCRLTRDRVALMFMQNDAFAAPFATATQYIHVDDVMALWEAIKDRCAAEWGPERMPYGMLEFAIRDPNFYLLSFGQPVA